MKIEAQEYLDLLEETGRLYFFDIEAVGLRGDYNSVICASFKPYGKKPFTHSVIKPGDDKSLVRAIKEELENANAWVTYYGKGFDIPFINTRLLRHGIHPIEKRPHLDMYFTLKANTLTSRRSQGHLLSWLRTPETKMTVSADDWNEVIVDPKKILPTMVKRCESDVSGLEALYKRTRHIVAEIKR